MHHLRSSILQQLTVAACVAAMALLAFMAPGGATQLAPRAARPLPPQRVVPTDQAATPPRPGGPGLVDNPGRGVVFADLEQARPDGPCAGLLEPRSPGHPSCTHGPDPAPSDIDVATPRSTADLAAATTTESGGVPCYGDGTSGKRVQAVYARAADVPDRYADVVGLIGQWAANADRTFADSAAETGGVRHVRWVTSGCNLVVERVQLSAAGDDSFSATSTELQALGFNRADRNYLLWVDANVYCGIGGIRADDRPTADNANNNGAGLARIDSGCWGAANPVEAHELMHNLGGVQNTAPNTSGGWHCTDEYDRMCYSDGAGVTMSYVCASTHERLFDCNHDDFFSTSPASGSYLATHWNAASSAFLESVEPGSTSPVPPAPTTTAPPGTTASSTTTTFSGSLNKRTQTRSHSVVAGPGTLTATASFTKSPSMTLTLIGPDGVVVAEASGASPVSVSAPVAAGTSTLVVSGSSSATYSVSITYPSP